MALYTTGFPADLVITVKRDGTSDRVTQDRLRGSINGSNSLYLNTTSGETTASTYTNFAYNTAVDLNASSSGNYISYVFRRALGFFDVVCYTGDNNSSVSMQSHNLSAIPELIITKPRNQVSNWVIVKYAPNVTISSGTNYWFNALTTSAALYTGTINATWGPSSTAPTSTQFNVAVTGGTYTQTNASSINYVAYLFATCPGVSKVGSYTGTGTTLQVNCGFTGGSRFVLIKRTDSTGDWYVWDSARGIVAGNDPYILLNSTAAEVTSTDYIDTYSAGFEISSTAPAEINASGGTYIFLAIA
jgi:hypothetical protein